MANINRHPIEISKIDGIVKSVDELCAKYELRYKKLAEQLPGEMSALGKLYNCCIKAFAINLALKQEYTYSAFYFRRATEAIFFHFDLLSNVGRKRSVRLNNRVFETEGIKTKNESGAAYWVNALMMAVCVRRNDMIKGLLQVPESVLRNSNLLEEECDFAFVRFLKTYFGAHGIEEKRAALESAYLALEPAKVIRYTPDEINNSLGITLDLFRNILDNDHFSFRNNYQRSVNNYKAIIREMDVVHNPEYFFDITLTGIVTIAWSAGFILEVTTDYVPQIIVEGAWSMEEPQ